MPRQLRTTPTKDKEGERRAASKRAYYLANKAKILARQKERIENDGGAHAARSKRWSDSNKPRHLQLQRDWYQRNRTEVKERNSQHYQANKESYRERNATWIAQNPERYRGLVAKWHKKQMRENPIYAIQIRLRARLRECIRKMKAGKFASALDLIGCTMEAFKAHIESLWQPGMSWENFGDWHLDHIRPLAAWTTFGLKEQQEAFAWSNFQPLWAADNIKKSDLLPDGTRARHKKRLNGSQPTLSKPV